MASSGAKGQALPRTQTGVEALDRMLNGGVPEGNSVLVSGTCGTGKTTLCAEFLVNGAAAKESSLYVAVTETTAKLVENLSTYEFFDPELVGGGVLRFVDLPDVYAKAGLDKVTAFDAADITGLLKEIFALVDKHKVRRLVIDSLTGICFHLPSKDLIREFVYKLATGLSQRGVTSLLVSELQPDHPSYSSHGVEDALVDGVLLLSNVSQRGHLLRTLQVVKMRGTAHSRSRYVMELSPYGVILVPLLRAPVA